MRLFSFLRMVVWFILVLSVRFVKVCGIESVLVSWLLSDWVVELLFRNIRLCVVRLCMIGFSVLGLVRNLLLR